MTASDPGSSVIDARQTPDPVPVLRIRGLRKVFGATVALGGVDVDVRAGQIHAILGENGAGKSTLVKVLAGIEPSDGGTIEVGGVPLGHHHHPDDVAAAGVSFIHQQFGLVGSMSVAENIALVAGYPRRWGQIDWRAVDRMATGAIARMGVDIDPRELVANLPVSCQQLVAIARALVLDARLLVLDEPTASLTVSEVDNLFAILRRLRAEGVAIIYISHRLDEVREICDVVTVMRDGRVVADRPMSEVTDTELVELIIGHAAAELTFDATVASEVLITLRGVAGERTRDLTFSITRGEVLGVAGLTGSGHAEIGGLLFGLIPPTAGEMTLGGEPYRPRDVADAICHAITYVPADRNGEAVALELNLQENLNPNPRSRFFARLGTRSERSSASALLHAFDVRPPEPSAVMSTLSGGNAQKVVLARCISQRPSVLILNDPTAAVDVGARREILSRVRAAAAEGTTVVLISSDMEEIAEACDRAVVVRNGTVSAELTRERISVAELTRSAYEPA